MKLQEDAQILANFKLQADYFQVDLQAPRIASNVHPGQFVHVQFPRFEHRVLRRPFSVYNAVDESGILSIIYKVIGEGTRHLSRLSAGDTANLLGPLGRGFTLPRHGQTPIIVAGGYGCAATYLLARRSPVPCVVLIGGRSSEDLLLTGEFADLGCEVKLATEDGSRGHQGLVTELLAEALDEAPASPAVYACGPNPMLKAVSDQVLERDLDAEISLDHAMCCGVGACFACVMKMKADTPEGWEYVRTCLEGPVFKASRAYWD